MIAADPRASALDTYDGRLGFRVLAHLTVKPRNIADLARDLGVSRQSIYRGLAKARAGGFGPEIDALVQVRTRYGTGRRTRKAGAS